MKAEIQEMILGTEKSKIGWKMNPVAPKNNEKSTFWGQKMVQ